MKKEYYIISGLNINDNNRGTAALGYGAFTFLNEKHNISDLTALTLRFFRKPWKYKRNRITSTIINNESVTHKEVYLWFIDYWVFCNLPLLAKFTKSAEYINKISFVAAINGGDGFSDIYGTKTFNSRLMDTKIAMRFEVPLIVLPQTLGPFKLTENYNKAIKILKFATKIYVRDLKFEKELQKERISYELTKDLSFYMKPQEVDIDVKEDSVGLNISGLCYYNEFRDLAGSFSFYPELITSIIEFFQSQGRTIYLISHSYNYNNPEFTNDDLLASKDVYNSLKNKNNVILIDRDLNSPQTKYIISRFKFFVGTRMHANFAAIFMKTSVFGLAYSYKYEGAFNLLGLADQYASVVDIDADDISIILDKIKIQYSKVIHNNKLNN